MSVLVPQGLDTPLDSMMHDLPPGAEDPEHEVLRAYLRIDPDDDARLREAGGGIPQSERRAFVESFYEHLSSVPELAAILSAPGRGERLRLTLSRYVDALLTSPIDADYLNDRIRTGEAHLRIGLLPRWYLGAYALFMDRWLPRLAAGDADARVVRAFMKRVLLDTILAMESYVSGRIEGLAREKESLDHEVRLRARRLAESERRYEELVENAPEMIHQVDGERRFVTVNRTALARLGYSLDELKAMRLEMIVPPAYRNSIVEHVEAVKQAGANRIETVFRTRSGREFPVEIYATAVHDVNGAFLHTRAFVRDLSDRQRLEGELARWERLAAVGSMAAKVAHEIRNPLSAISLNVELIADELAALPEERRVEVVPLLNTILGGVDRLNAITEEYLSFARLPPMEVRDTSLHEVFHKLELLTKRDLERRDIALRLEVEPDLPGVAGDGHQLGQVFLNLIRNSQDAMPDGGEIRIRATRLDGQIEIVLADTGIGIPEQSLAKIFDPFFTTKDAGTGLGLAYVQQVLLEHRARITCRSRVGEGTEFRILIPTAGRNRPARVAGTPGGEG